ncbi:hypothetical protein Goarm_020206, partial [Gossypium armourianum]|nr:hypothetical protein [Gossypium armourianum]
ELNLEANARPRQSIQRANTAIFFDAAFDSQNSRSASGLVVKNEGGRIVAAKSMLHDNIASPFAAEAYARFQATNLGIHLGCHTLDIIGDSKIAITKCQNANRDRSKIGAIISDIQSLKGSLSRNQILLHPKKEKVYVGTWIYKSMIPCIHEEKVGLLFPHLITTLWKMAKAPMGQSKRWLHHNLTQDVEWIKQWMPEVEPLFEDYARRHKLRIPKFPTLEVNQSQDHNTDEEEDPKEEDKEENVDDGDTDESEPESD